MAGCRRDKIDLRRKICVRSPVSHVVAAMDARTTPPPSPTPEHILQVGLGFWASKTLLSAIELGVFTELARRPATEEELGRALELNLRSRRDFLDALVALGFLRRDDGRYANTTETELFLDRNKPSYVGGLLEMANARLYGSDWMREAGFRETRVEALVGPDAMVIGIK